MAAGEALPRIDHIIIAAKDLSAAKAHFLDTYGLGGYEGGKHQGGWGTENWLIPLGAGYIEIAAVWDPEAAQSCDWGRYIAGAEMGDKPWKLMTFCVQTADDAADISKRLDHMLGHMVRVRPDGSELTWRVAAMSRFGDPGRGAQPFFITWDNPALRPDKIEATTPHTTQPVGIDYVEVAGDKAAMADWIGSSSDSLPLRWAEGPPGLRSVGIKTADGRTIVLE